MQLLVMGACDLRGIPGRVEAENALMVAWELGGNTLAGLLVLDGIGAINDHYGHPAGDDALLAFSEALAGALPDGFELYRWSATSFLVLCDAGSPMRFGRRLEEVAAVAQDRACPLMQHLTRLLLGVSTGVFEIAGPASFGALIRELDFFVAEHLGLAV